MNFDTDIKNNAALAPMAGVTDEPMRRLCMEMGASFCVSEMISAKALSLGDNKTKALMAFTESERPFGIQIFGTEPDIMADAAAYISENLRPDFLDINMGCPAPKIAGSGAGSALMKDPVLAGRIAERCVRASAVPVTVKMRAGWETDTAAAFASVLEQSGVSMITVHGRTAKQMYRPPVDLSAIRQVKKAVSVPVIGNGDIFSPEDAVRMMSETGCDGVMIGRGAMGDPFLFARVSALLAGKSVPEKPSAEEKMRILRRHAAELCELKGEYVAMREMRRHAACYIKGFRGAAALRAQAAALEKLSDIDSFIDRVLTAAMNQDDSQK